LIEKNEDLWEIDADWLCITTNKTTKSDGRAVMGRGCAAEAVNRVPGVDINLGKAIRMGCDVTPIGAWKGKTIFSFPVKKHWRDKATLELIRASCMELRGEWMMHLPRPRRPTVAIPRPGCGCGGLDWDQVRPVLEVILKEDNFIVIHKTEH